MNSILEQPIASPTPSPAEALQLEEYRNLLRGHVSTLRALFKKLTGLESSVAWAPTWPHRWSQQDLPIHSRVCRRFTVRNASALERCQNCGMKHLALTVKAGLAGHTFLCHNGVRNFWFPISLRGCTIGIGFVQAQDGTLVRRPAKAMAFSQFKQAAMLLNLIFQHAQTSALADWRKIQLNQAQQAVLELQAVASRLREELHRVMPALRTTPPALQPEDHSTQIVHDLLDCLDQDFAQPLTLQGFAAKLGLNVSYLSHLFSCAVGMPFKTYLTELRIEKARELLSHPATTISEVAYAVGYASENRFRIAFKKVTHLSPRTWRETLRMSASALLMWFFEEMEFVEEFLETFALPALV